MRKTSKALMTVLLAGTLTGAAAAQSNPTSSVGTSPATNSRGTGVVSVSIRPEAATLTKLGRRISLKVEDTRLEDVLKFIQESTQAEIEAFWTSDSNGVGLDKDKKITLDIKNQAALHVLEAVLDKARSESQENTWQMSDSGILQVGPKEALNKTKRIVMYNIDDLLMVIPRYAEVPQIDLNNVLQSGAGGSSGSPFNNANGNNNPLDNQPDKDARAKKVMDLLTSLVESPQWQDNGGDGASMHFFNGTLIVNAPDYIHRAINGYPYWAGGTKRVAMKNGHRWVTLNTDNGISTFDRIRNVPVTAVVGGQGGGGGGGGGGGTGGGGGGSGQPGGPP